MSNHAHNRLELAPFPRGEAGDWVERGLCLTWTDTPKGDPTPWDDDRPQRRADGSKRPGSDVALAVSVCRACPVRVECLEDAMTYEEGSPALTRYTIRGGLTGEERAALQERERRAAGRAARRGRRAA